MGVRLPLPHRSPAPEESQPWTRGSVHRGAQRPGLDSWLMGSAAGRSPVTPTRRPGSRPGRTEFIDLSDTQKNLVVEIPSTVVDAEIDKVSRDYSKAARIPGFRPGKVPAKVVRQRFRDQILHDVAHGLIPRAVDEALRERGVEPVDTPDIRDVVVEEGQPLKFTASFETVPPIEPEIRESDGPSAPAAGSGRGPRTGIGAAARAGRALRTDRESRYRARRLGTDGSHSHGGKEDRRAAHRDRGRTAAARDRNRQARQRHRRHRRAGQSSRGSTRHCSV